MKRPYLSVVIPAYNEADWLAACLQSLQAQTGTPAYEIIVVDNASTDETAAIARKYGARVIFEKRRGVCFARQAGLMAAHGEIMVSTDADCTFEPDWLSRIAEVFQKQPDVSLLSGNYRFSPGPAYANILLAAWEDLALRMNYAFDWRWYVSAANLAFRKDLFDGYDTNLTQGGDEIYVLKRLAQKGRVLYRFDRPVRTSGRRLRKGFGKVLLQDFFGDYLLNYWRSVRTGINKAGSYEAHRDDRPRRRFDLSVVLFGLVVLLVSAGLVGGLGLLLTSAGHPLLNLIGFAALTAGVCSYGAFYPTSQLFGPQPFRVRTNRRMVALSFDDGPNGSYTKEIASILERYHARASFFCVGENVQRESALVKHLHDAGHLIGVHSWSHQFGHSCRPKQLEREFAQTKQLLEGAIGEPVCYGRLPWLFRTPWLLKGLRRQNLLPVAGRFASLLEVRQPDGVRWARRAYQKVRPGSIIIMHDGYDNHGGDRRETVRATEELCRLLTQDGYELVRIDELL